MVGAMSTQAGTRRLVIGAVLLGLFVLFDLALFGWLVFQSLSKQEVEEVLLETREEAENLAERLAQRAEEGGGDLFTAVATEQETQTYIDSILHSREVVQDVEIRDAEGRLVFQGKEGGVLYSEPLDQGVTLDQLGGSLEEQTQKREIRFETVDVEIGEYGFLQIGISRTELEKRVEVLRRHLLQQAIAIAGVSLLVLLLAYGIIRRLWKRGVELEEKAAEAERMAYVGTLASGLAHEIRSPLNSLNLNMQMLEEDLGLRDEDSRRRLMSITQGEIGRLERLVSDFLTYARPGPAERRRVQPGELLRHCYGVLEGRVRQTEVQLIVDDRAGEAEIWVDPAQFNQLLLNLVQNALAAVEGTGRTPTVRLASRLRRDEAILEVSDNGAGIPKEDQEKVFDLFFSRRKGGTGLGLAIVRRIADTHGGHLEIESEPGVGTQIRVVMPLADASRKRGGRFVAEAS